MSPFILTNRVIPTFDIGKLVSATVPTVVTTTEGNQGVRVGTGSPASGVTISEARTPFGGITDGGYQVNPGAAAVIVDTGQLVAGDHTITAWLNGSALFDVILEWRDAANAANNASFSLLVGGAGVGDHVQFGPMHMGPVLTNERFRIVTGGAVVGTLSSAISARQVFHSTAV